MTADRSGPGRTGIVIHVPKIETHDLDPDSATGLVGNSSAPPAVRIDGEPVDIGPRPHAARRVQVPLVPGPHRVEVMVKQSYEVVQATVAAGEATELHIGYRRDRMGGDDRLVVGTKTHVARALNTKPVLGNTLGCGSVVLVPALIGCTVAAAALSGSRGIDPGTAALTGVGAAVAIALLAGAVAGLITRLRPRPSPSESAPPPIPLGPALILPAAAEPPQHGPGILLRVQPRARTLNMIGFPSRMRDPVRASHYEFYFNESADRVSPPRVHLDGRALGSSWGTWWIPVSSGTHRLRVELAGIGDARVEGFSAETELALAEGERRSVDARFNFLAMADRRPGPESRWQLILRRAGKYEPVAEQAAGEPLLEFHTAAD